MAYFFEQRLEECTVSLGADRSERSEDKNGTKNFSYNQRLRTTAFGLFLKIYKIIFSLSNKRKIELCSLFYLKEQRPQAYFSKFYNGLWPIPRCIQKKILFNFGNRALLVVILKRTTAYGLLTKFLTLDYPILWAGIEWRLLREICVSSRRQQLLPPRGSKFRVVMARCQNLQKKPTESVNC